MHNDTTKMIVSTLEDIIYSLKLIKKRCETIHSSDDFLENEDAIERLDGISMRLIAIGEGFKNIDKLSNRELLVNYPNIPWKKVKGIRDILSHHYFQLDSEVIFEICQEELDELLTTSIKIMNDI